MFKHGREKIAVILVEIVRSLRWRGVERRWQRAHRPRCSPLPIPLLAASRQWGYRPTNSTIPPYARQPTAPSAAIIRRVNNTRESRSAKHNRKDPEPFTGPPVALEDGGHTGIYAGTIRHRCCSDEQLVRKRNESQADKLAGRTSSKSPAESLMYAAAQDRWTRHLHGARWDRLGGTIGYVYGCRTPSTRSAGIGRRAPRRPRSRSHRRDFLRRSINFRTILTSAQSTGPHSAAPWHEKRGKLRRGMHASPGNDI